MILILLIEQLFKSAYLLKLFENITVIYYAYESTTIVAYAIVLIKENTNIIYFFAPHMYSLLNINIELHRNIIIIILKIKGIFHIFFFFVIYLG